MRRDGKLLVIEAVIAPGNDPSISKLLDLQMLSIGGKKRSEQEFARSVASGHFKMLGVRLSAQGLLRTV